MSSYVNAKTVRAAKNNKTTNKHRTSTLIFTIRLAMMKNKDRPDLALEPTCYKHLGLSLTPHILKADTRLP